MDDLSTKLRKEPCAREGYLYGMSIGVGVAVLRFVKKGSLLSAGNWGVVAFAVGSVVSKKLCCFQRAHYHAKVNTLLEKHLSPTSRGHVDGFEDSQQPIAGDSSKKEPPS
ncbi:hypothetical protein EV178_003242 [Coemansia sp. RSA 1646]|nr:hypothetical protein EV178_003242 [Coemansia sp. RSA 1646]